VLKARDVELSDLDVEMEAERIAMETFVHHQQQQQQETDSASHSDILVLDSDTANSRASSSKKSQKKPVKQRLSTSMLTFVEGFRLLLFVTYGILKFNHNTTPQPFYGTFFRDHPGEPVPEENFWTL